MTRKPRVSRNATFAERKAHYELHGYPQDMDHETRCLYGGRALEETRWRKPNKSAIKH